MQYEILAYSARYDARKGRLTYWDICSDKPTGRRDTDFEFLDYVNTDDGALLETPYSYGRGTAGITSSSSQTVLPSVPSAGVMVADGMQLSA